jgi:hypothetical protein
VAGGEVNKTEPCPGCGKPPVNVGKLGRFQYACQLTTFPNDFATDRCISDPEGETFFIERYAVKHWNEIVEKRTNSNIEATND